MTESTYSALLHGPDQSGLVARVSGWIFSAGGNILHADQHRDGEAGVFFQRIEWVQPPTRGDSATMAEEFVAFASTLGMTVKLSGPDTQSRVMIFVSRVDHCFHDLILRWKSGEYPGELVGVVSNHSDLRGAAESYGLPFHHIPVQTVNRTESEIRQMDLLRAEKVDLIILARYMQILSGDFLRGFASAVINIHHSFLPAFAGGRPYHQAHERGVKLIGATAHYATAVLDDGPIIHQDVVRVTHRHSVEELVRKGRDMEKMVLAHAVRMHLEHRVLVYGNKTVVFD